MDLMDLITFIKPVYLAPITDVIKKRYSCRAYQDLPIRGEHANKLRSVATSLHEGPLKTPLNFNLFQAGLWYSRHFQGLESHNLVINPPGYLIGAVKPQPDALVDYGYGMENLILYATQLGLDTCWLGGTYTRIGFYSQIRNYPGDIVPAVAGIGYAEGAARTQDIFRRHIRADIKKPWEGLFFNGDTATPLKEEDAEEYAPALEMVRLSPSRHNHQPWRILKDCNFFHFFLDRTSAYMAANSRFNVLGIVDLLYVEIGIAMCHFNLTARELGLEGYWLLDKSASPPITGKLEYVATWAARQGHP